MVNTEDGHFPHGDSPEVAGINSGDADVYIQVIKQLPVDPKVKGHLMPRFDQIEPPIDNKKLTK